jgi:chorismate mutase/prephenate dehydratase
MTQFKRIENLKVNKDTKVMYYGVEGTYTQQAMEEFFGTEIKSINNQAFRGVMDAVESGKVDYGVLPIENSSTGGISDNYDLLIDYDVTIVGEHILPIDQCLLGVPGTEVSDIREVYSHPQGIWQCSDYLEKHPQMKPMEFASTAECAKKVANEKDKTKAAIASKRAASMYGLEVLGDSIQKDKENSTRFMIISNKKEYLEESNKIALCIELPHESGSLYGILSHFLYNDLNLSLIQSRPIKGKPWEYRFFVDVEGNLEQPEVRNALRGIKEEARKLVVLGNFVKHNT